MAISNNMFGRYNNKVKLNTEDKELILKLSLYFISLWILLFMLIVLKIDIQHWPHEFSWNGLVLLWQYNSVTALCIVPSHDIYYNVYEKIIKSDLYIEQKNKSAQLLYNNLENLYIDKFKALPILLKFDNKYSEEYMSESINLLNYYYEYTEYGKINLLCETIVKEKYAYSNNSFWNEEKLWLYYLYADCLDHCGSLQQSWEYFQMVWDFGVPIIENDKLDFVWDAKAQIFNIRYALLDTDNLLMEIENFLKHNFSRINMSHSPDFERAYLNTLNRQMVVNLLIDEYKNAVKIASKYRILSKRLNNKSHMAYFYIDFTRGIYHIKPNMALRLMKKAYNAFLLLTNEKRRLIDTESEIKYLECIVENKNIKYLDEISEQISEKGYTHMYVNSIFKRAALRIKSGEFITAQNLLIKVSRIFDLDKFPRSKLLFCNLMSAIYFDEKKFDLMKKYIIIQNDVAKNIGKSYQNNIDLQNLQFSKIDFNYKAKSNYFPIETRMW